MLDQSTDDEGRRVYTRFKVSNPQYPPGFIDAAWKEARGDEEAALQLLQNPNWRPSDWFWQEIVPWEPRESSTTGRVKEVEEAHKAQRAP